MPIITVKEANSNTWDDLQILFGRSGGYWGCWCMFWRFSAKEFNQTSSEDHRIALEVLVNDESKYVPGLLAYKNNIPVGWIGFGPRTELSKLARSRVISKVDDKNPLSIICFFIHKQHRGSGVGTQLIKETIKFAKKNNFGVIESYPISTDKDMKLKPENAYMGTSRLFEKLGFTKVKDTKSTAEGKKRVIMRFIS